MFEGDDIYYVSHDGCKTVSNINSVGFSNIADSLILLLLLK